jgi:hypothetical protein
MTCKNMDLVKKLTPTIFNAFNAFYDDIFELLINELLTEEVFFYILNYKGILHEHVRTKITLRGGIGGIINRISYVTPRERKTSAQKSKGTSRRVICSYIYGKPNK